MKVIKIDELLSSWKDGAVKIGGGEVKAPPKPLKVKPPEPEPAPPKPEVKEKTIEEAIDNHVEEENKKLKKQSIKHLILGSRIQEMMYESKHKETTHEEKRGRGIYFPVSKKQYVHDQNSFNQTYAMNYGELNTHKKILLQEIGKYDREVETQLNEFFEFYENGEFTQGCKLAYDLLVRVSGLFHKTLFMFDGVVHMMEDCHDRLEKLNGYMIDFYESNSELTSSDVEPVRSYFTGESFKEVKEEMEDEA
jgi:hypothetical protein